MIIVKRIVLSFLLAVSFLTASYSIVPFGYCRTLETAYVGSVNSNKYHKPFCRWAKKINPENLVSFETENDAAQKGYVPCKVCRP